MKLLLTIPIALLLMSCRIYKDDPIIEQNKTLISNGIEMMMEIGRKNIIIDSLKRELDTQKLYLTESEKWRRKCGCVDARGL